MRFFKTFLYAGALSVAAAQATTGNNAPTPTAGAADPAQTSAQAAMIKCIEACTPGDVNCTAKCIAVPNPDASQVDATHDCVAKCPQGNGTETDILNYENCVNGCVGKYYYTATGTPQATDAPGSGSGSNNSPSGSGSITPGVSQSGSPTGSASGAAASTSSKAAADIVHVAGSAAGLIGFLAAFLAI
jgi:hypothetical protein